MNLHIKASYKMIANDEEFRLSNISLVSLPKMNAIVKFQVVNIEAWPTYLILSRDFLRDNKLHLIYNSGSSESNKLDLLDQVASTEILESTIINNNNILEIKMDFGFVTDIRVKKFIKEIKNSTVKLVQDVYSVKVNLKDNTTCAFVPPCFAYRYMER